MATEIKNGLNGLSKTSTPTGVNGTTSIKLPRKVPNMLNGDRKPNDPLTLLPGVSSDEIPSIHLTAQMICGKEHVTRS